MQEFLDHFKSSKVQPQVFSLILVTIILIITAIVVYRKVKKQEIDKAPGSFLLITEMYVMGMDNLFKQATDEKIQKPVKPAPYIFTLMTLLLLSNLMGLLGLETPTSSYSFTLSLALVSWIGIYVIGITYQKWRFFEKFLNPIEMISQFAPLISLSFRLFGNMIGGATIMYLLYTFTGYVWHFFPVIGEFNLLGSIIAPWFHAYFDIFDGLIQAFVFTSLTMAYWTTQVPTSKRAAEPINEKSTQKIKTTKMLVKY